MNALKVLNNNSLKTNNAGSEFLSGSKTPYSSYLLLAILFLIWPVAQYVITSTDPTMGSIDPNIWLLLLLSLICFMVITGLCSWLLQQFWTSLGLPVLGTMVLQFKELSVWQQLGFYWASFVCLLLAAVGVLTAIL